MKKGVKIAIIVVAILLVLTGVGVGLYFLGVFNFLKPADKMWSSQVEKALDLKNVKITDYAEYLEDYKDLYKKSSKSKFTVTADLSISELDKDVQKVINNSKIVFETATNPEEKNSQVKTTLETSDSEVLQLDVVTNGSKVGIGSKDLYDKYLAVSIEDLENYITKNTKSTGTTLQSKTSALTSNTTKTNLTQVYENMQKLDMYNLLYISKDDLKSIEKTYSNKIKKSIDKKCYTKKDVKVSVDGDDVKTTGAYLTLSGEQIYRLLDDITSTAKDDEVLSRIILEKANILLEAMGEEKVSSDDVKEALTKAIESYMKQIDNDSFRTADQGIQIAVYSKGNTPVRLELNLIEDMDKIYDGKTIFSIEYAKKKTIYSILPGEKNSIVIVDEYTKNTKDERKGTLTFKYRGVAVGTADYEIVNKSTETKLVLNVDVPLADIKANIEFSSKGNYKKEPLDVLFSLEAKYGNESAKLKVEGTVDYTADVSIPTLSSDNSVDILKLDATKQNELADTIMKKASEVLPSRLKLLGVNVKAEDIYNPQAKLNTTTTGTGTTTTTSNAKPFDSIEKDTVLVAKKATTDVTSGAYTQIIEYGFKNNKPVAVRICMEFKNETFAKTMSGALKANSSNQFKDYAISVEGNKIYLDTAVDTYLKSQNISTTYLTQDAIKTVLEGQGYTVEVK